MLSMTHNLFAKNPPDSLHIPRQTTFLMQNLKAGLLRKIAFIPTDRAISRNEAMLA